MIRNQLVGRTVDEALQTIANLATQIRYLPANSLHEASFNTQHPTHSGVSEGNEAGILEHIDDQLRKGQPINDNAVGDVHAHVWNLFHWDPPGVTSNSKLAAIVIQHAYSMMLAYPHIPELQNPVQTLQQGFANNLIENRIVDSNQYNWANVRALKQRYGAQGEIPQYMGVVRNNYANIVGAHSFSVVDTRLGKAPYCPAALVNDHSLHLPARVALVVLPLNPVVAIWQPRFTQSPGSGMTLPNFTCW